MNINYFLILLQAVLLLLLIFMLPLTTKRKRRNFGYILKEKGFIPEFTEITVFLTSFIFLILLFFDDSFQAMLLSSQTGLLFIIFALPWSIYLSIKYVIPNRPLHKFEKKAILAFSIFINAVIGICAGYYEFQHSRGISLIFPIFNIASAILLWLFFKLKIITIEWVSNKQVKYRDLIIGMILVFILFFISHNILKNYWTITFSICLFYATNINEFINKTFFKQRSITNY